mmetsp:Transcript_18072/g.68267  ORF Transcript_18072/g.68267 Transcript_18072/m.68267 type:complete len:284 (-) Transcript_18072:173-1024(-)
MRRWRLGRRLRRQTWDQEVRAFPDRLSVSRRGRAAASWSAVSRSVGSAALGAADLSAGWAAAAPGSEASIPRMQLLARWSSLRAGKAAAGRRTRRSDTVTPQPLSTRTPSLARGVAAREAASAGVGRDMALPERFSVRSLGAPAPSAAMSVHRQSRLELKSSSTRLGAADATVSASMRETPLLSRATFHRRWSCCRRRASSSPTRMTSTASPLSAMTSPPPCVESTYFSSRALTRLTPRSTSLALRKLPMPGSHSKYRTVSPASVTTEPSFFPRPSASHSTPT